MPNDLSELEIDEVSLVGKGANNKKYLIIKSMESEITTEIEPAGANGGAGASVAQVSKEDVDGAVAKAVMEAIEKEQKERSEAIKKAVDEAIAKEQAEKADLKKALDIERDVRVTKEYIEKATVDFPNLPGTTPVVMGPILKEAQEKLTEASFKALHDVLKAASAALGESALLYKELGSDLDAPTTGSAAEQLDTLAKARAGDIRKSVEGATLDSKTAYAIAYDQVCKEHKDLFVAERKEYLGRA